MEASPIAVFVGILVSIALVTILVRARILEPAEQPVLPAWIAVGVVFVVALSAFLLVGSDDELRRDEAIFVVTNIEVANGNLPYVAAFDNTGPVGPWYGGLGVALGRGLDVDPVTSARIAYLPVALLGVAVTYVVARWAGVGVAAAAIGATALVALPSFTREALSGPRPKAIVLVLVVLYVAALAKERFGVAGFVLGVCVLVWQATFVLVLAPVVHALWREPPPSPMRSVTLFLAGGLAAATPVLIVFAAADQLPTLVEGFVTWSLQWGTARLPTSPLGAFIDPLEDVWGGHMATWPLVALGGLALLPTASRLLRPAATPSGAVRVRAYALVVFALLAAWTLVDHQGVVDLVPFWGLIGLGVALVAEEILLRSIGLGIALTVVILAAGLVDVRRVDIDGLGDQRAEVAALVGDGCRVASYGQPEFSAFTGQSNPHPEFAYRPGVVGPGPEDPDAYITALIADRPHVVGGWTNPDGSELGAAATSLLPAAGYEAFSSERIDGWRLRDATCG